MPTLARAQVRSPETARGVAAESPAVAHPRAGSGSAAGLPLFLRRLSAAIQARLISDPDDIFEQEADAVDEREIAGTPGQHPIAGGVSATHLLPTCDRETAGAWDAKAFTQQNHVWPGPEQSASGVSLSAHEAVHMVQQTGGATTTPSQ
jgi:hypothetical protein